jgi:glycosyltransferase involved in cell wall biosynthesis
MRFTIFTPTYNRAHTLPRLYESIRHQTLRDFEWVIVDDGSTDGTAQLIHNWQQAGNDFPIRYFWQPNQHKKVAFNRGVLEARAPWFVPIDSDDELLPDTLEKFARMWATIPEGEQMRYCAVMGLYVDSQGHIVGDAFPGAPLDADSAALWFDYRISGDKVICLRTEALRQFPFPEDIPDLGPEGVVWFRMARVYQQRCFNEPVGVNHRDVESITRPRDPRDSRRRRAQGAVLSYAEAIDHLTLRRLLRSPLRALYLAVQHGRFGAYLPRGVPRGWPKRWVWRVWVALFSPLGLLVYALDRWNIPSRLRDVLARLGLRLF